MTSAPSTWFGQVVRIQDGAAIERGDDPEDLQRIAGRRAHFDARRHPRVLFHAACDSHAPARGIGVECTRPSGSIDRRLEHGRQALIGQVAQTPLDGVDTQPMRDLVYVGFPGERVRGRGERTVRALSKRRIRRLVRDATVRYTVGRLDRAGAGVQVGELPGHGASRQSQRRCGCR